MATNPVEEEELLDVPATITGLASRIVKVDPQYYAST